MERKKDPTLDGIVSRLLIPRKSFLRTAFTIAAMPEEYLDPLEVEKRSGVSRASVYKELKIMSEPPFQWLEKKGDRKFAWRRSQVKFQLERLVQELDKIVAAIEESKCAVKSMGQ